MPPYQGLDRLGYGTWLGKTGMCDWFIYSRLLSALHGWLVSLCAQFLTMLHRQNLDVNEYELSLKKGKEGIHHPFSLIVAHTIAGFDWYGNRLDTLKTSKGSVINCPVQCQQVNANLSSSLVSFLRPGRFEPHPVRQSGTWEARLPTTLAFWPLTEAET